ncbi:hypothetical protein [Paracoccus aminophilus]|uniref:hypothetical protein n=1 Tax=Paracoccus aminophilus TaxID=34003 RepID=UPI00042647A3|nr:hypothetical protein [Paracoccus aminophilus]
MKLTRRDILRMASGLAVGATAASIASFEALAKGDIADTPSFLTGHFRAMTEERLP